MGTETRLKSPLPLGEGLGEGLQTIDRLYALTRLGFASPPSPHGRGLIGALSMLAAFMFSSHLIALRTALFFGRSCQGVHSQLGGHPAGAAALKALGAALGTKIGGDRLTSVKAWQCKTRRVDGGAQAVRRLDHRRDIDAALGAEEKIGGPLTEAIVADVRRAGALD